jgi:hypothetical protein
MEPSASKIPWIDANQAYLVAEFARLKRLLDPASSEETCPTSQNEVRAALESPPAIDSLTQLFGLSVFERDLVLLCAGVEMDSKLATLCAETQGHPQRTYATFGLAMAILPQPHWSALTPARPLRRLHLLELEIGHGLTSAPLRIDERILHYLAGINILDPQLQPLLRLSPVPVWIADSHKSVAFEAAHALEGRLDMPPVINFCGDDPEGQEDAASMAVREFEMQLLLIAAEDLPTTVAEIEKISGLWERESILLQGALLIQLGIGDLMASARRLCERLPGPLFLASREPVTLNRPVLRFDVNKPPPVEQRRLWITALGPSAAGLNGTLDELSEQFRISAKGIFSAGGFLSRQRGLLEREGVWAACRSFSRPKLEHLAERVIPCAGWDDLVLPAQQKQMLRQLAAQVRHRMKVYERWGFSAKGRRGLGVSTLFAGESGTGKTMAAEVLANELALDLYRIDLSAVVSKYIGETEKNLKQVFDAADEGGVLLLFDEADALFGKRAEVKDSHDRYANIEVSYLLQRMETYRGLAILTTNLKASMDRAFHRRLRFIVNFPFPDAGQREAIWRGIFPPDTPQQALDAKKLSQLNVTGGNIRNIALNAAFLAAESNRPVEMTHVLEAAKTESQKIDRPLTQAETRGWL